MRCVKVLTLDFTYYDSRDADELLIHFPNCLSDGIPSQPSPYSLPPQSNAFPTLSSSNICVDQTNTSELVPKLVKESALRIIRTHQPRCHSNYSLWTIEAVDLERVGPDARYKIPALAISQTARVISIVIHSDLEIMQVHHNSDVVEVLFPGNGLDSVNYYFVIHFSNPIAKYKLLRKGERTILLLEKSRLDLYAWSDKEAD